MRANNEGPVRTCVGCRSRLPQAALRRFVRAAGGPPPAWRPDPPRRRSPGRGAYLCSDACAQRVKKNKRYPGLWQSAAEADFASPLGPCMIERPLQGPEQNDML